VDPTGTGANAQTAGGAVGTADSTAQTSSPGAAGGTGNVAGGGSSAASASASSSASTNARNGFGVNIAGGNRNRPITTDSRTAGDLVVDPAVAATNSRRH
jgi:hypothetical protein